ncbi:DNA polymerase family A-domain-containing protein [Auriculariales sp. MPI-PUGE-AT-0066]|nr:DNA polymerase family A-domain-containing protein [Auriculariales sp. MPI-PUGE-AT-0066]
MLPIRLRSPLVFARHNSVFGQPFFRTDNVAPITKPVLPSTQGLRPAVSQPSPKSAKPDGPKRNEVGVQLLSRHLHEQIFPQAKFPAPPLNFVNIAKKHLSLHGLDPKQGADLPDLGFTLPPLQGESIDEHFYRIGHAAAEPYLSLAKSFAVDSGIPKPAHWNLEQSGWTKYERGDNPSEEYYYQVDEPNEQLLCFDVETMPHYSNYAVMATARSPTHWYSWISPWLLGETDSMEHLIPLGDNQVPRLVIGHNVSYDRQRIANEYSLERSSRRFIDTMSLHCAVKGISSNQRPAWNKWKKQKKETIEMFEDMIVDTERRFAEEGTAELDERRRELRRDLAALRSGEDATSWEELTSANSLLDVAVLHCNIILSKDVRDDIMTATREEVRDDLERYLAYCAEDVHATYSVYRVTLPKFLAGCPSPVSFAGVLSMGSAFLPVNEEWQNYITNAEKLFQELEQDVKGVLQNLVSEAIALWDAGNPATNATVQPWKDDVWLSQLDWTPKKMGTMRKRRSQLLETVPKWLAELYKNPLGSGPKGSILPILLQARYCGYPMWRHKEFGWVYGAERGTVDDSAAISIPDLEEVTNHKFVFFTTFTKKTRTLLAQTVATPYLASGMLSFKDKDARALATKIIATRTLDAGADEVNAKIYEFGRKIARKGKPKPIPGILKGAPGDDTWWGDQLDWTPTSGSLEHDQVLTLPAWYLDLLPFGDQDEGADLVELTVRSRLAPLLLRLDWRGYPLFHLRQHGWTYRVPSSEVKTLPPQEKQLPPLTLPQDIDSFGHMQPDYAFFKLPHKDGEEANVGSPLAKAFVKYADTGILTSPSEGTKQALKMNAQGSYWISVRDRVTNQMVVWETGERQLGFANTPNNNGLQDAQQWGIILPQVITMGTVTRRAIEKTWLTASNAKENRIGSELKAMIRAPPGYAIVGADVDSEELWISSVMGDAQFGLHGATAIGWMTLEGTKAAGTDLHSNSAKILGISRNYAKVFNYSRIYGAGMKHASLLLQQSNPDMSPEAAQERATQLYAKTKGRNTYRTDLFDRKFWYGGSESYVFNKLEEIAMSDSPQTPALGCGVTDALAREYLPDEFGLDYLPSRINWVVQSSGVDYLHLLIVSMEYLLKTYDIKARYLISVHDELRYLVTEADKYRAALALQIANLWTRCQFAYRLGMDDLPQGVAFFSAVDVDWLLRKEVDMACVTPSQTNPLAPGESLDIQGVLDKTHGGSLWANGESMKDRQPEPVPDPTGYTPPDVLAHRAKTAYFLEAQATQEFNELKLMAMQAGYKPSRAKWPAKKPSGNVNAAPETLMTPTVFVNRPKISGGSATTPRKRSETWKIK